MQHFCLIGTAHVSDPRLFEALEEALEETQPDQLILEMPDEAATSGQVTGQKAEMLVAYRWAERRGVAVHGHEPSGPPILRAGLTDAQTEQLVGEMDALVSAMTTRRVIDVFCGLTPPATVEEQRLYAVIDKLVDPEKALERSRMMAAAVRRLAIPRGTILVICGGAHTPHIAGALPGSRIIRGEHFY